MTNKKVFVSGCYDLLHSGHIEFFKQASRYGDLYVGIGSDRAIEEYKHHKPMFPEEERLFMVSAVRYVKEAVINAGSGVIDFLPSLDLIKPDVFVVNAEGGSDVKRKICAERGIEYIELQRTPAEGLQARSSSALKKEMGVESEAAVNYGIPTRLDLAGTWIDQPYVSQYCPGWAITMSVEPTFVLTSKDVVEDFESELKSLSAIFASPVTWYICARLNEMISSSGYFLCNVLNDFSADS